MVISKPIGMIEEVREDVRARGEHTALPPLQQVLEAVHRLNGSSRSLISLNLEDGSTLMIGGSGGAFVCTIESARQIINVTTESDPEEFVSLVVGGQEVEYPSTYIVSFACIADLLRCADASAQVPDNLKFEVLDKD